MAYEGYDFAGYATRYGVPCADGRIIDKTAFLQNDGKKVPLVYNHQHNDIGSVLGHAFLECREDGVYSYGYFNDTDRGIEAKNQVIHGDLDSLSIWANRLQESGNSPRKHVVHGDIKELSLVLAGANPGAFIEEIVAHSDEEGYEAFIYSGDSLELNHSEGDTEKEDKPMADTNKEQEPEQKSAKEVFDEMTEEQKQVAIAIAGQAVEEALKERGIDPEKDDDDEGGEEMGHSCFDNTGEDTNVLSHDDMVTIVKEAEKTGRMSDAFLSHGIENIEYLFPDAQTINGAPDFIKRNDEWVNDVMNNVHHTPFSRIKSVFADITEDEARAKGYIKGKLKKEEVFSLLKRTTTPQTIYKKQKIDRDDYIDIVDLDVVAWIKTEMRMMLDEEIARAILVGDGRLSSSDDKISEDHIRPIWTDADLYTIKASIDITKDTTSAEIAKAFIVEAIRSRVQYKGSGTPTLYAPDTIITECLLLEDKNGRMIYDTLYKLATVLRVSKIVPVPVMENLARTKETFTYKLLGIIVNLKDYNVGADKGGAVNMFDDFDIDYNAMKYLIETRCSGAMIKPYGAIAIETKIATSELSKASSTSGQGGN
ncbi:MAG: HK97 family phage prohead protease [Prevotella sp.]|nr:HK97 family phage prohead protease [Prevotella sp.]